MCEEIYYICKSLSVNPAAVKTALFGLVEKLGAT